MFVLSENQKRKLHEIVDSCYVSLKDYRIEKGSTGLFSGGLGVSFFNIIYEHSFQIETNAGFNMLQDALSSKHASSNTYCSGTAGTYWLLNKLSKNDILEIDPSILTHLKQKCLENFIQIFRNEMYDYLHGGFGILHSLICSEELTEEEINSIINQLLNVKLTDKNTFPTNYSGKSEDDKGINLHLAHGISSYIIVLSELHKLKNNDKIKKLVFDQLQVLIDNYSLGNLSCFPLADGENERITRIGWCYGDLGIALAIHKVSDLFNQKDLDNLSKDIWITTSKRRTRLTTNAIDASVCHGLYGNLLFYWIIGKKLKTDEFNNIIELYLEKAMQYFNKYNTKSFYYRDQTKYTSNNGILTGNAGIGLTCMSLLGYNTCNWEEMLLLN